MSQSIHASDEVTTRLLQTRSLHEKLHALKNDFANETVPIIKIFYPLVNTSGLFYLRSVISMDFLGRLGAPTLAGSSLALAFPNMTAGLTIGAETICLQAIGAKRYNLFRATIRRGIISTILTMLKHDNVLASIAHTFMLALQSLPDLVAQCFLNPLKACLYQDSVKDSASVNMHSDGKCSPLSDHGTLCHVSQG